MGEANAIEAVDLRKSYGEDVQALDGLTFSVPAGTVFGLLGPNGAGKSTTVKILTTLAHPDGGSAKVAGHDILSEAPRVRESIGVVSQAGGLDREATGRENLRLQGQVFGMGGRELERRIDELLEQFRLGDAGNRLVREYSGGMQRRLDVAQGLVHKPQVLFLDEPTTGLDPEVRAEMWDEIARLAGAGLTVLLTTHYLEEADRLAAQLAIVDKGKVVAEGSPDELKRELRGDAIHIELGTESAGEAAVREALARVDGLDRARLRRPHPPRPRRGRRADRARGAGGARRGRPRGRLGDRGAAVPRRRLPALRRADVRRGRERREAATNRRPEGGGAMKALRDTRYMTVRHLMALWRQPWWIAVSLIQPVIWLLLFGALFKAVTDIPGFGSDNYIQFLAPGVVVMTAFFGAGWAGMPVIEDIDRGVIDRFLVSPVRRGSLISGRLASWALTTTIQSLIIVVLALIVGATFANNVVGVVVLCVEAVLVGAAFGCLSIGLALLIRKEETLIAAVQFLVLPLSFMSVTFMQKSLMPDWMQTVSNFNPLNWAVEAGRDAVTAGPDWGAIAGKTGLLVAFLGLCAWFATRAFRTYQRAV